ncbi:MAG: hypothetical protein ACI8RZ_000320 [Myxococcota bacterium]|jgi:hypothetical protein
MPTHTRSVVFTDLVNYTEKTARSDRESLRRLIALHEEWTREVCEPLGGRLVKSLGDAFMTLFSSATDALRASLKLAETGLPGTSYQLRASVATGDVEEIDGDAFGEAANLAARLSSMTPGGEVWFTESTRRCANLAEIPWEPVGVYSFKGIPEPTPCFRAPTPIRCVLPEPIALAARSGSLVRVQPGRSIPRLSPSAVILFEGFSPNDSSLETTLAALPVLDPAQLWLSVYTIPPAERRRWTEAGRGLVIGTTTALDASLDAERNAWPDDPGKATVFLDGGSETAVELVLAGVGLPSVPLGGVVAGYSYDLLSDGRWVNASPRALLRVDVSGEGVYADVLAQGISIAGRTLPPGSRQKLSPEDVIITPAGEVRFRVPRSGPYLGLLEGDSSIRLAVGYGETAELGRNPNHPGIALPDRGGQSNLRWCSGSRAERTRAAGFTLDRALVGRRQASVGVDRNGQMTIGALHHRLATYLYRDAEHFHKLTEPMPARIGDLLVMGSNVVALRASGG